MSNFKSYCMFLFFAGIPITILGVWLSMLSTHSGGVLLLFGMVLSPGLYVLNYFNFELGDIFWFYFGGAQYVYFSMLFVFFKYLQNSRKNKTMS